MEKLEFIKSKIVSGESLERILSYWRFAGKKIVFTNGCFDIIHVGHTRYLKSARKLGDVLVVAVNSDVSVRGLKGPGRPVNPETDRMEVLSEFPFVDFVVKFNEATPFNVIKAVLPDALVKGGDWPVKNIVGGDFVIKNGGKVINIPFIKGRSTTKIIQKAGKKWTKKERKI